MAAVGDFFNAVQSTATGTYLDLRPANSGEEIFFTAVEAEVGCPAELYKYDGTNRMLLLSIPAGGIVDGLQLRATRTTYYQLKNTHASTKLLACSGDYAKV